MKLRILTCLALTFSLSAFAAAPPLTDAQITKVVLTVDKGEAELGKLAKSSSKNPEVLSFADHMITDHTKSQQKTTALATKLSLTPEDSEKSMMMKQDGDKTKTELMSKQNSKTFDKAYIDAMVAGHEKVLKGIDEELMPSAKSPDLRAMLKTKRESVASHLKHAQEVQAKL